MKYTQKDFAWVNWTKKDAQKEISNALAQMTVDVGDIIEIPSDRRTYDNTVRALDYATVPASEVMYKMDLMACVSTNAKIRESFSQMAAQLGNHIKQILRSKDLYAAIRTYQKTAKKRGLKLTASEERLLKDQLYFFDGLGFNLASTDEKKLLTLWNDIAILEAQFNQNLATEKRSILVKEQDLKGLSDTYKKNLSKEGGLYKVGLSYPEIVPFMEHAHSAPKRKQLATLNLKNGGRANLTLLKKILAKRQMIAELLGHDNHADLVTKRRIARTGKKAQAFMVDIGEKASLARKGDIAQLQKLKRKQTGDAKAKIEFYDVAYYSNLQKKELYGVDDEEVRQYLPLKHVQSEIFLFFEKIFGISITHKKSVALWHKNAQLYEITDKKSDLTSYIILDLHPRKGKYGHAAAIEAIVGRANPSEIDTYIPPVVSVVCNFSPPNKKGLSLLSHNEVVTLFHECGHALHMALGTNASPSQSGFNVAWDFVEMPSQMFEYFAWDTKTLQKISSHHETKKPLPKEIIEKMQKAKQHMRGYATARQAMLALYDLEVHTQKNYDVLKGYNKIAQRYTGITPPASQIFAAGFGHLIGYSAAYYSYMWAQVYAADAYTVFEKSASLAVAGKKLRKEVLSKGAQRSELESLKTFLGRTPNKKAFYKELGI